MATNPDELFADLMPSRQASTPRFGPPPKPSDKEPPTTWRTLTADEIKTSGLTPGKIWQVSSKGETKAVGDAAAEATLTPQDKEDLKAEALSKLRLGASLIKRSREGWFTTGFGAGVAAIAGGGPAYDVKADTETLKNAGALQRVMELNKKTGKNPLTPLSNSDFQALASSISNLDTNQSDTNYQKNVRTILDIYRRTYLASGGSEADIAKIFKDEGVDTDTTMPGGAIKPAGGGGGGTGGDNPPPGLTDLNADQTKAYKAFLAANPKFTDEQLGTFLEGLTGKQVTNTADIAKSIRSGSGFSTTVKNLSYEQKVKSRLAAEDRLNLDASPAETLTLQSATGTLSDEAAGVGNALSGLVTGDINVGENYRLGRDVERLRVENARDQLGYGGSALEFVGGLAMGRPGVAALEALTPKAVAVEAAKGGAAGGVITGFGSGEGAQDSLTKAVGGGIVGGALGAAVPTAVNRFGPRSVRASPALAPDVAAAADRQNVSLIRPMVDESALENFNALKGTANAGPTIEAGASRVRGDIEQAVVRLGQGGNSANREAQGEALRAVAQSIKTANREGATAAYRAAESLQPDAMVDPASMRQAIDNKLQQLALRPSQNRAEIRALERYRADLNRPLPLQEIRNMRTDAYDNIYSSTSRTPEQKRADKFMRDTIDGANADIEAALAPEALAAYKEADALHRENKTFYRDAFKPLFGSTGEELDRLSAEQIHDRFKRALNTNGRAIAAFHRRMPTEQSRDFAATIAEQLGRAAPDEPFDAQLFLNQTKDFSPSATRTLFGPGGDQAIKDLRLLSRKLLDTGAEKTGDATRAGYLERQSWRQLARSFLSGVTGLVRGAGSAGATAAASGAGYYGGGIAGATVAAGTAATIAGGREVSRVLSARAMTNPRVARWLAGAADVSSHKAATESVRKLGVIIAREPALVEELQPLYDILRQRVSQPLAAQPQGQQDEQQ